jgi:D-lactate dehydrogenase
MFIIESGEVAVLKHTDADDPVEITRLRDGDVAGEMSLLGNIRRSATLRVVEEAQIWELGAQDFQQQVEHNPALARALLSNLTKHLHRETSVVAQLMSRGLDRRFRVAFFDSKPYIRQAFDEALEQGEYALNIHHLEPRLSPETVSLAAGSDAVCVFVNDNVNEEVVEELAALDIKLIALRCAGYNNVDLAACAQHGVSVARVPAYSPYAVAEHAVAMMMTLNRRTHRANGRVREGNFSLDGLVGFDVHGKTVGVVGTGKIGCCFTQIMAGFGCRLLGYDKFPNQDLAARTGLEYVPLEVLLAQSDIISLHAPLLPETHYLVDEQAIAAMKDGVMLLNTSRGGLIKTSALLDGLKSRKVGYAGLDVYEEESAYFFEDFSSDVLTDDILARLTTFNNVLVTSHQAFLTHDALIGIAGTTCANIREFADGKRGEALQNHVALPAVREDAQPVGASG